MDVGWKRNVSRILCGHSAPDIAYLNEQAIAWNFRKGLSHVQTTHRSLSRGPAGLHGSPQRAEQPEWPWRFRRGADSHAEQHHFSLSTQLSRSGSGWIEGRDHRDTPTLHLQLGAA